LSVGVYCNKLHASQTRLHHPVQSINPTAADANNFYDGLVIRDLGQFCLLAKTLKLRLRLSFWQGIHFARKN
jgi:uncharacterized membrane protein